MQIYDPNFEIEFWKIYPRKAGKPAAHKAWLRLRKTEPNVSAKISAAIERFKMTEQWADPRFVPYPATFLNQRRWEDEAIPDGLMVMAKREWDDIRNHVQRAGRYSKEPVPVTDRGKRALLAIGGFRKVCDSSQYTVKILAKKFARVYKVI